MDPQAFRKLHGANQPLQKLLPTGITPALSNELTQIADIQFRLPMEPPQLVIDFGSKEVGNRSAGVQQSRQNAPYLTLATSSFWTFAISRKPSSE
jgi:hypothetical protein